MRPAIRKPNVSGLITEMRLVLCGLGGDEFSQLASRLACLFQPRVGGVLKVAWRTPGRYIIAELLQ
jgi:hypothetical protein